MCRCCEILNITLAEEMAFALPSSLMILEEIYRFFFNVNFVKYMV